MKARMTIMPNRAGIKLTAAWAPVADWAEWASLDRLVMTRNSATWSSARDARNAFIDTSFMRYAPQAVSPTLEKQSYIHMMGLDTVGVRLDKPFRQPDTRPGKGMRWKRRSSSITPSATLPGPPASSAPSPAPRRGATGATRASRCSRAHSPAS
jgi:hypothetical protein